MNETWIDTWKIRIVDGEKLARVSGDLGAKKGKTASIDNRHHLNGLRSNLC